MFSFCHSPVPIPFQYVASVWALKNQIVKRNQKNSYLVQIVAVAVSSGFVGAVDSDFLPIIAVTASSCVCVCQNLMAFAIKSNYLVIVYVLNVKETEERVYSHWHTDIVLYITVLMFIIKPWYNTNIGSSVWRTALLAKLLKRTQFQTKFNRSRFGFLWNLKSDLWAVFCWVFKVMTPTGEMQYYSPALHCLEW